MSKKIKIRNLKIILAAILFTTTFSIDKITAMEMRQTPEIKMDDADNIAPIFAGNPKEYSEKIDKINYQINSISTPKSCSIKQIEETLKNINNNFNNLKQEINKLNLNNQLEYKINSTNQNLKKAEENFKVYKEENKNKIEITKDMIDSYIPKMKEKYENLENIKIKKDDIIDKEIINNSFFQTYILKDNSDLEISYNEFIELSCIDEKGLFNFKKLINALKKLGILQPKLNNEQSNKNTPKNFEKQYNSNTINPDMPNKINIKQEDCFISKEIENYCKQKLSSINTSANNTYRNKKIPQKIQNNNISLSNLLKGLNKVHYSDCYINPLKEAEKSLKEMLSDENIKNVKNLKKENKIKYLSSIKEKFDNINSYLILNPNDNINKKDITNYTIRSTENPDKNLQLCANDNKDIILSEKEKEYLRGEIKKLENSLDDLFQKFKENIIKLNENSYIDCYIQTIIAESNYYYSKLLRYNLLKAKPEAINKNNLKYILKSYDNVLKNLCLNDNDVVDIKELDKILKELGIIKNKDQIKLNEKEIEKIKINTKEILNKLENIIDLFCKKYNIKIDKFMDTKTKNYCEKFGNEIAPPLNIINKISEDKKDIKNDDMLENENIKIDILKNKIAENLNNITNKIKNSSKNTSPLNKLNIDELNILNSLLNKMKDEDEEENKINNQNNKRSVFQHKIKKRKNK